ncbi:polyprotein [Human parechovirus 17]|uniref:Genome polyprotein n=1 Tax=Human parechovirus 17 TaxID=1906354 RepID=A0A0Y0DH04_9PICO|nr:polyprotein [Human parechovirus 17]
METIKDLVNTATGAMENLSMTNSVTELIDQPIGNEGGGEIITKVADDASNLLGPNSFATTSTPENKDVVQATTTVNTTNLTQHPSAPTIPFMPDFKNVDNFHSMAYDITTGDKNPSKLVRLDTATWQSSYARQHQIMYVNLPSGFWDNSRKPAYGQSKYFAAVRCGFHFQVQVNVNQGTAGSALVVYEPKPVIDSNQYLEFGSRTNLPHVLMNLAETTQADLCIPYVSDTNYVKTDSSDLGQLKVYVWTPLSIPNGASTDVDVTVMGSLLQLDFQNPRPYGENVEIYDSGPSRPIGTKFNKRKYLTASTKYKWTRTKMDIAEGPGSMNMANVLSTTGAQSVALVGERAFYDPRTAGSKSRFGDLIKVAQLFSVMSDTTTPSASHGVDKYGYFNWSSTTAPQNMVHRNIVTLDQFPNLNLFMNSYLYFRGSLILRLSIYASTFNRGRLRMGFFPNCTHNDQLELDNAIYTICDIGSDNSFELTIPYSFSTWMRKTHGHEIGLFQIEVLNRLTYNSSSPNTVHCIVQGRLGDDAKFFCPTGSLVAFQNSWGSQMDLTDPLCIEGDTEDCKQSISPDELGLTSAQDDGPLGSEKPNYFLNFRSMNVDIFTVSHTKVDNIFGRAWYLDSHDFSNGDIWWRDIPFPKEGHGMLSQFFAYFTGELNIHILYMAEQGFLRVAHTYDTDKKRGNYFTSNGVITIPAGEQMTLSVPFYSNKPLRMVRSATALGHLMCKPMLHGTTRTTAEVYISLRCPNFFFPVPAPKPVNTKRSIEFGNESPYNTEPSIKTMKLAYLDRGFYKHYGLIVGDFVYQLDSDDIFKTALTGKAKFTKTRLTDDWVTEEECELDYFRVKYLESAVNSEHIFSVDKNCETIAKDIFGTHTLSQHQAIGLIGTILLTAGLMSTIKTPVNKTTIKEFFNHAIEGDEQGLSLLVQKCTTFFSSAATEILDNDLVKFVIKILVRILCYMVLYCHKPNILTTACLSTLLIMDVTSSSVLSPSCKALMQCLMDGDVKKLAEIVAESMSNTDDDEIKEQICDTVKYTKTILSNQGPFKGFNEVSTAFRHIDWWIHTLLKIKDMVLSVFKPSIESKAVQWLERNKEHVCGILDYASDIIVESKDQSKVKTQDFYQRYSDCLAKFKPIMAMCFRSCHNSISNTVYRLFQELARIPSRISTQNDLIRVEPIGIWIQGEPGQGKSFLTHTLSRQLQKSCKLNGIFTNPTASEFMDGYDNQDIHLIDDLGQTRKEKDIEMLCNCISAVPFVVPMAHLEEKGKFYTSKLVIATTNKSDFSSTVLQDSGALKRRFPYIMHIRAAKAYSKAGKLNVSQAMAIMSTGECWEVSKNGRDWETLKLKDLVDKITLDYNERIKNYNAWKEQLENQTLDDLDDAVSYIKHNFPDAIPYIDEYLNIEMSTLIEQMEAFIEPRPSVFKCFANKVGAKISKASREVVDWFSDKIKSMLNFVERNKAWLTVVSAVTSAISILLLVTKIFKKEDSKDERAYNPTLPVAKSKGTFPVSQREFKNEAPYDGQLEHIISQMAYITGSTTGHLTHCAGYQHDEIILHGHSIKYLEQEEELTLHYKNKVFPIENPSVTQVTLGGKPMDLAILKCKLPFRFKKNSKYYTNKIGTESMLIWMTEQGIITKEVQRVHHSGGIKTREGTESTKTISYTVKSCKGMCGGLLVSKVEGNFKILGMHIAGNGEMGVAIPFNFLKNDMSDQGIVTEITPIQPMYINTKSQIHKSPVYGAVEVKMGPAVLSKADTRLEEPIDCLIKKSASKYRVNRFQVNNDLWQGVKACVKSKFREIFGINGIVDMKTAILGTSHVNSMDLSTSAGYSFVKSGYKKKDLICLEPFFVSPMLEKLVQEKFHNLLKGNQITTIFNTCLKDELRKLDKIAAGKTRCIEACEVDYCIVYRMIMMEIYDKIYQTPCYYSGLAVGINPYKDWHFMINALNDYNYEMDYSQYDGSLSSMLLWEAVEVLAYCHDSPDLVMQLHKPVIDSDHVVFNERWLIHGGMPSGSPCTTVLNSLCNLMMCIYTTNLISPGIDCLPIVYGDDVILSLDKEIEPEKLQSIMADTFGAEVTGSRKDEPPSLKPRMEVEFLKRKPGFFPESTLIVGKLDTENMIQHLMWMKNFSTFKQQLQSYLMELCLHGKDTYQHYIKILDPYLKEWNIAVDDYEVVIAKLMPMVFD